MKFIVENKLYDTEKAEKLCVFQKQWKAATIFGPMYPNRETALFKTAKGAYFLTGKHDFERYEIEVITEEKAKYYLMYNAYDLYAKMFGELEEA